jgi:peptide/nickel transport system substrate-binding protein
MTMLWTLGGGLHRCAVAFAAVVALITTGCAGNNPQTAGTGQTIDRSGTLTVGISTSPSQWDPHKGRSMTVDYMYMGPIYDRLLFLKSDLSVGPMLATSYQISPDHLSMTLKLRTDVKFHDGTSFNADAVVANFKYTKGLTGYPAQNAVKIVKDVVAVDPSTARIDFNSDGTNFPITLAQLISVGGMASPVALQSPEKLATFPVGSGPYKLVEQRADRGVYQRVPGYWDANVDKRAPERFELRNLSDDNARVAALQSGQIDAMMLDNAIAGINQIADGKTIARYRATGSSRMMTALFNMKNAQLVKPEVRQALSLATERRAISDTLFNGDCTPTVQPFAQGSFGFNAESGGNSKIAPDLTKAKQLLAQAGAQSLTLSGLTNTSQVFQNTALALQAQWALAGVKLNLTSVPPDQGLARWASGNFDVYVSVTAGSPDPGGTIDLYYTTGGTYAQGPMPKEINDLSSKARLLPLASTERDKAYQTIAKYLADIPVSVIICNQPPMYLHKTYVVGLNQSGYSKLQNSFDGPQLAVLKH